MCTEQSIFYALSRLVSFKLSVKKIRNESHKDSFVRTKDTHFVIHMTTTKYTLRLTTAHLRKGKTLPSFNNLRSMQVHEYFCKNLASIKITLPRTMFSYSLLLAITAVQPCLVVKRENSTGLSCPRERFDLKS